MAQGRMIFLAWIILNRQVAGARIMDIEAKEIKDVPIKTLVNTLNAMPTLLENVMYNPMDKTSFGLVGTQGDLRNYPQLEKHVKRTTGFNLNRMYITANLQGLGFEAAGYNGKITKIAQQQALEMAKNGQFCNASLMVTANGPMVVSLGAEFPVKALVKSKYNGNVSMGSFIKVGTNRTNLARQVKQDTEIETEYQDSFGSLSQNQRNALVSFYTWYTVDTYEKIAKTKKLNVNPNKLAKLSALRGETEWTFGGIIDTYLDGRMDGKCSLGHSLRYEYFAVPSSEMEKRKLTAFRIRRDFRQSARQLYDEMGAIVFGETCASDFFDISKEDMSKLVKIRQDMSSEIALTANIVANNLEEDYTAKHALLSEVIEKLGTPENISSAFGIEIAASLMNFINNKLPFTKSLVLQASKSAYIHREFILNHLFPKYTEQLKGLLKDVKDSTHGRYEEIMWEVFDYFFKYSIEGAYQYDPLHDEEKTRKDVGRYNKETRYERQLLNRSILIHTGVQVESLKLSDLEDVLMLMQCDKRFKSLMGAMIPMSEAMNVYGISDNIIQGTFRNIAYIGDQYARDLNSKGLLPLLTWLNRIYKLSRGRDDVSRVFSMSTYTGSFREVRSTPGNLVAQYNQAVEKFTGGFDTVLRALMQDREYTYKRNLSDEETKRVDAFIAGDVSLLNDNEQKIDEEVTQNDNTESKEIVPEASEKKEEATETEDGKPKKRKYTARDLADLKKMFSSHEAFENGEDYGLKVAIDIVKRGLGWDKLSKKQQWRIGNTVDRIRSGELK